MAILIKIDGSEQSVTPKNGKSFTLHEMQSLVGGYVQKIAVPSGPILLMDEDGKNKNKPRNKKATGWGELAGIADDDYLVGDVLLCNENEIE